MKDCPVAGCAARIDRSLVMCRRHWYSIPQELRARVWQTYRRGAGILDDAYRDAVEAAVDAANRKAAA